MIQPHVTLLYARLVFDLDTMSRLETGVVREGRDASKVLIDAS